VRQIRSGGAAGKFLSDTVISQVTLCQDSNFHDRPIDREILGIRGTRLGRQIRFNFIWLPPYSRSPSSHRLYRYRTYLSLSIGTTVPVRAFGNK
jgi:hypothetical protein